MKALSEQHVEPVLNTLFTRLSLGLVEIRGEMATRPWALGAHMPQLATVPTLFVTRHFQCTRLVLQKLLELTFKSRANGSMLVNSKADHL